MDVLAESAGKTYGAVTVVRPADFTSPFTGTFACMIWDHDGRSTYAERSIVAASLLASGCSYAVCGGEDCEAWHDAVDDELVARALDGPDDEHDALSVMTTWHDGESPDDVAYFFVINTDDADHEFRQYLVLHVGTGDATEQVDAAVRKHALDNRAR